MLVGNWVREKGEKKVGNVCKWRLILTSMDLTTLPKGEGGGTYLQKLRLSHGEGVRVHFFIIFGNVIYGQSLIHLT